MILTPDGKLSRYLYGIRYPSRDFRFALAEAAEGKLTMAVEKILLFCYHYDPQANRYVLFAMNVMRAGGILTVLIISFTLWRLIRADRLRMKMLAAAGIHREGMA
jgi:protein SCO1/2